MSTNASDLFITGLKNAHAMESQALSIMRPQLQRIENYPMVAQRLQQHIGETEQQVARIEQLLDDVGADKSPLKDAALSAAGTMAAVGHAFAGDEIIKNAFANHAFENFEIAAYTSLCTLAELSGQAAAVPVLQQNLAEEEAMAQWIIDNLPELTTEYASRRQVGEEAKR